MGQNFLHRACSALLCIYAVSACSHHVQPPLIDVIRVEAAPQSSEPSAQQRLRSYLQRYPHFRSKVRDAVLLIDAERLAAEGTSAAALARMREAFLQATGEFRKHVFTRYLTLLADSQAQPQPLAFFVEHAKEELRYRGRRVAAMISKHLTVRLQPVDEHPLPRDMLQLMQEDPTLEMNARRYCRDQAHTQHWQMLLASFSQQIRTYWRGLTSACLGNAQEALRYHRNYLRYATATSTYPQLALTAAAGVVAMGRKLGKSRMWLADSYAELATLWQQRDYVDHDAFNLSSAGLLARKINDLLWAARYRTLSGAYEQAVTLVQQSLKEAQAALAAGRKRRAFLRLIAEAYHILAFRIAAEQQDYAQAIVWGNTALQYDLNPDWRERFLWYNGLYHYLQRDWQQAASFWQESMTRFPTSSIKPRLLFWLAMVANQVQDEQVTELTAAEYLETLEEEFPLSYYNVFAARTLTPSLPWYEQYRRSYLQRSITEHKGIDLRYYHRDRKFALPLLRAEIFIAARLFKLARVELRELERRLELYPRRRTRGLRLYLTRLYFASHSYTRSMNLVSEAIEQQKFNWHDHPEQMLIYFPQPYLPIFGREAFRVNLEPELLLAVARQESAFQPKARSRADALGLMQIILPTAREVANAHRLPTTDIEQQLLEPATNIKLGSLLLRRLLNHYRNNLPAVLAAYNAGEEAVDIWLQRRAHPDPRVWIELIPFGETKNYVMRAYRNYFIYRFLSRDEAHITAN